ncbi:AAA family ATPase [uncultured Clostridium sp.]|uniref:ParA family protein n=1 Tax=uncultured Clostridium sp. TaxID=59620 RepID=UPI0025F4DD84|nr:AAA family ATPase [uncultured Clostridium sp.]
MIYSIMNQKGGVAKTTSTFNIGAILAEKGKRVLLVDLDPQHSLTIALGIDDELTKSIYNVICEKEDINNVILEVSENLYIAPSNLELSIAELQLVSMMARESILKKALDKVKDNYDIILIDCPPSLSLLTVNALVASNEVIVPTATDYLSYKGLELLIDTINNVKENLNEDLKIKGVIATMYDKRTKHANEVLEALNDEFNVLGTVKISVAAKDSVLANEPLISFAKSNDITKEYIKIAEELL